MGEFPWVVFFVVYAPSGQGEFKVSAVPGLCGKKFSPKNFEKYLSGLGYTSARSYRYSVLRVERFECFPDAQERLREVVEMLKTGEMLPPVIEPLSALN